MKTLCMLGVFVAVQVLVVQNVNAQRLTERYIPIGKSPGLSGKNTSIATIDTVDTQQGTMTCTGPSGTITVKVDQNTKIWLDRSKQKLTTLEYSLGDCRKGQIVEVKFRNNDRGIGVAEWIKVATP